MVHEDNHCIIINTYKQRFLKWTFRLQFTLIQILGKGGHVYSDQTGMYIMIIAIKIRLCHLLCGTILTTNFGGKSIQVKPSVMHEACKRNVCWNRPLYCWERMSKWHIVVGVLSLLKNVKMAELNEEQGDEWPGSPSFLMRALCYWFIAHLCSQGSKKKTDIHLLWYVSQSNR